MDVIYKNKLLAYQIIACTSMTFQYPPFYYKQMTDSLGNVLYLRMPWCRYIFSVYRFIQWRIQNVQEEGA